MRGTCSAKQKFAGAPQCTNDFTQDGPPAMRFTEQDRPYIIKRHQARGEAQSALIHWDATAQSRALLLREAGVIERGVSYSVVAQCTSARYIASMGLQF